MWWFLTRENKNFSANNSIHIVSVSTISKVGGNKMTSKNITETKNY